MEYEKFLQYYSGFINSLVNNPTERYINTPQWIKLIFETFLKALRFNLVNFYNSARWMNILDNALEKSGYIEDFKKFNSINFSDLLDVEPKWTPPEGLFTKSAKEIAQVLHDNSKDLKQAMARLNFYINRGGEDVPNKDNLEKAKDELRKMFNASNADDIKVGSVINNLSQVNYSKLIAEKAYKLQTQENFSVNWKGLFGAAILGLSTLLGSNAEAKSLVDAIIQVESGGKKDAVGDKGKAKGILQIWDVVIQDVNRVYGTNYKHDDAFDPVKSKDIFDKYTTFWAKQYQKKTGKKATDEVIARIWNGGPKGWKNPNTLGYWNKVKKEMEK
jgi:hypothetical protein